MSEGLIKANSENNPAMADHIVPMADLSVLLASIMNNLTLETWVNGVHKASVKQYLATAVVAAGKVRFYLTDNGLSGGNAIFTNIYIQSRNLFVDDIASSYVFGNYVIDAAKKYVEFDIRKLNTTASSGLINLIGGATSFVTGLAFTAPANGVTVYLQINGD